MQSRRLVQGSASRAFRHRTVGRHPVTSLSNRLAITPPGKLPPLRACGVPIAESAARLRGWLAAEREPEELAAMSLVERIQRNRHSALAEISNVPALPSRPTLDALSSTNESLPRVPPRDWFERSRGDPVEASNCTRPDGVRRANRFGRRSRAYRNDAKKRHVWAPVRPLPIVVDYR